MTIDKNTIIIVLVIIGALVLYILYRKNFKILKVPSVCLVTGGVKTGKSLLCVNLSLRDYKKRHRQWFFRHLFDKDLEEPLYYTNCKISFGSLNKKKRHRLDKNIRAITLPLLMREERFAYKSVVYFCESSLTADNMDYNNAKRNVSLSLFNKLIGHETRGGALYYDTQSPLDNHYSIKRVSSVYYFIEKDLYFGLFHILYVRELINQENGVNAFNDDVETSTRKVFVPFWYHHKYDRYEFSYLTDTLKVSNQQFVENKGLVSFNPLYVELSDKRIKESEVN